MRRIRASIKSEDKDVDVMKRDQQQMPLLQRLAEFAHSSNISFHVPGHKSGVIFPQEAIRYYSSILPIDMTELSGLDDLHAPGGVIAEAQRLAAEYFQADHTFFLTGGSTAGNLAMILAACNAGEKIIVQRNSHKSIMNGLELSNARPVFIAPDYDLAVDRYTHPSLDTLEEALQQHPDASAVVLTYPDYFGKTYHIEEMIRLAHNYQIPVLVDEAHGVHFSLGAPFPPSALALGADVVVQSAHKMAPAMTMASYLHIKSAFVKEERVAHFLQIIQSSSPSYPLMASLDIARAFLAGMNNARLEETLQNTVYVRDVLGRLDHADVLPLAVKDDPLKVTLHVKHGSSAAGLAHTLEQEGVYPELATHNQILFIQGLAPFSQTGKLAKAVKRVNEQLKISKSHDIIEIGGLFPEKIKGLALSYTAMNRLSNIIVPLREATGKIAAEPIIPYPPGIPLVLRGEEITETYITVIEQFIQQGVIFQHLDLQHGIKIFAGLDEGEEAT